MNFNEQMRADIESCNDMGGVCSHFYNETSEELEYLYFEEHTEVIFDSQSEFSEAEASVPSLVFATHKIGNVSHSSLFEVEGSNYCVVSIQGQDDGTTRVYLGTNQ